MNDKNKNDLLEELKKRYEKPEEKKDYSSLAMNRSERRKLEKKV